nr:HNH endonuclease signature motif containing protein [Prescottella equi]
MTVHGIGKLAHRCAYESFVGPIPDGMTVDHTCFKPACINPDHLRILSLSSNAAAQRSALTTHCIHGHEFTPENTYIKPGFRNGKRQCRICQRAAVARYKERNSA